MYDGGMLSLGAVLSAALGVAPGVRSRRRTPRAARQSPTRTVAPTGCRRRTAARLAAVWLGAFVALPTEAGAQGALLDTVASGPIAVGVDLTDDCELRAELVRAEAELTLRRAGVDVAEAVTPLSVFLLIHGVGVGNPTSCAVAISFNLLLLGSRTTLDGAFLLKAPIIAVIRGDRSAVMRELRAYVNENVTVWANDLRRARDRSPD